jgi:hypothetical protein
MHDFEIFKNKHPATLLQLEIVLDLGYLNFRMKKKKGELLEEEKKPNR